ncbi:MAG: Bifunctional deaminase-reductase domain protein [Candidatus Beckwithbacteria bacterium GW2011_GWA2_43_10]|uniref:Bifunctional deaminase-reductase domain protein n=1 Tax=Candidatus Beckwithbacteria bacterium GW2011_GWA2_43_10 TaxID=1618369 RepID=A0A0G1C371_9BACT|nr:MAG: Bifunctional deaminase-reductase domain protein [Candidatus Beckwithbacteria bacterium GW2011_GWA2_43_10]
MGFKEVILTGGSINNSAFGKLGLINEIILDIEGVIIGQGIPLFNPEEFELKLQLKTVKKVTENILQLHYKVV